MTSHQFARQLLAGPDLLIGVPQVVEYSDSDYMGAPVVTQEENEDEQQVLIISYSAVDAQD